MMIIYNNFNYSNFIEDNDSRIFFNRKELDLILRLYGRFVAAGEWRDYGISMLKTVCIFSIYKRSAECPIYIIEKKPELSKKTGMYSVVGMDGRILKRGNDLYSVLNIFNSKLLKVVK